MKQTTTKTNDKSERDAKLMKLQIIAAKHLMSAISRLPWTRDSIVAGGAPRDWYMGMPATDIDIFLFGSTISQTQLVEFMEREGFGVISLVKRKAAPTDEEYYTNPKIKWVFDGQLDLRPSIDDGVYPVKFQIIVTQQCESVAALLATFPVEISKFTWNHLTGKVTGEPGALLDVQHKTLTQTYHDITQKRYVQKIRAKFPGHKFVDTTVVKKVLPPSPTAEQVKAIIENMPIKKLAKPKVYEIDMSNVSSKEVPGFLAGYKAAIKREQDQPLDPLAGAVRLEADQFAYWLQGFFEMANPTTLDERQVQIIKDHLALVFNKATPDRDAMIETAHPKLLASIVSDQATYTGHSPFRGDQDQQARVVPPTAILPLKTYVSC